LVPRRIKELGVGKNCIMTFVLLAEYNWNDHIWVRPCGPVIIVPGCRPRGPRFCFKRYHIFLNRLVGLKRGPLSFMWINEELLERRSSGSGLEN
jgi:hypothetical protein